MSKHKYDLLSVIKFVTLLLKLTGFWKSENIASFYNGLLYNAYRIVAIIILVTHVLFEVMYFFKYWSCVTISQLASVLFTLASGLTNSAMLTSLYVHLDTVHAMIRQQTTELFQPKYEDHYPMLEQAGRKASFIKNYFIGNLTLILIALPSLALYRGQKIALLAYRPPWFGELYFFIVQVIGIGYHVYISAIYVVFNCTMLIQIGVQIDMLKSSMEHIDGMGSLLECARHYSEIIR